MLWLREIRPTFVTPGMTVAETTKIAGRMWQELTDKSKWEQLAVEEKDRYSKELAEYKESHPATMKITTDDYWNVGSEPRMKEVCIYPACNARFRSRETLEQHLQTHYKEVMTTAIKTVNM